MVMDTEFFTVEAVLIRSCGCAPRELAHHTFDRRTSELLPLSSRPNWRFLSFAHGLEKSAYP